ncbi:hypothetical protein TPAR_02000 [Tolypocladium paradoxum]|uniref:Uncharacterized protein n=1 Tax=Tolypocladium paradoxum TaxID=94208 RepID=A0A2S4L5X9_9HYPO|nr:hypothetical protein TPAR_02000 [Tolypocladium paradoxum]
MSRVGSHRRRPSMRAKPHGRLILQGLQRWVRRLVLLQYLDRELQQLRRQWRLVSGLVQNAPRVGHLLAARDAVLGVVAQTCMQNQSNACDKDASQHHVNPLAE